LIGADAKRWRFTKPLKNLGLVCTDELVFCLFQLLALLLIVPMVTSEAKFFKINTQQRPRCKQIYETIYTQQCSTTYAQQCNTVYETEYKTEYEQSCSTSYEQQCKQVYRDVPDKQCSTSYEQECFNEEQTTYETTYRDDCQSVPQQVPKLKKLVFVVLPLSL
jgi:hypothetical protein